MNQIDTPRTKAAINASGGQWSFVLLDCSSELERELTAAREKLAKAGVGDYKADYFLGELTETGKLRSELKAVTEQRDRLVEAFKERDRLAEALRKFVGDALFCSHADTATTVLPQQQVDDSGDALIMP